MVNDTTCQGQGTDLVGAAEVGASLQTGARIHEGLASVKGSLPKMQ